MSLGISQTYSPHFCQEVVVFMRCGEAWHHQLPPGKFQSAFVNLVSTSTCEQVTASGKVSVFVPRTSIINTLQL